MNRKKIRDTVLTLSLILILSFLLNYIWESVHEAFLYEKHSFHAEKYTLMMLRVATVDAFIILGIYLGVATLWKDILWLQKMRKLQVYISCLAGLLIAAIIEYWNVLVVKEWSYAPGMPTIFGIGLSPLLQLSTTGLLTFWVVRRILYQKKAC
jgi:hypothetical protein